MKLAFQFFALAIVTIACSKPSEEEQRRNEQEKLEEHLNKTSLTFYKAVKVALRTSADPTRDPEVAKAAGTILQLSLRGATSGKDSVKSISVTELITMSHEFYAARDVMIKKSEDDFPTIFDNIRTLYGAGPNPQPFVIDNITYDQNFEHVILGILWTASRKAPIEFPLYELHKVEEANIATSYLKSLTELAKALAYSTNGFPWHALDNSAIYISDIEQNKQIVQADMIALTESATVEQCYYQHHLLGMALHGVSQLDLERQEEALKDFEIVLTDAEKGGLDNELVWLIGAYVHIHNEDNAKALIALEKLEKSAHIPENEKTAIRETKEYLASRENGKAFNTVRDKIALTRIGFHFILSELKQLKQLEHLQQTSEGNRIFDIQQGIHSNTEDIQKLSALNIDSLASTTKSLVKDLIGN
jgi:hypothetical protein